MAISKNQYEVGYSAPDAWREVSARCSCCQLPFTLRYNKEEKRRVPVCEHCVNHVQVEDESIERRADRAEEHEARVRALLVTMSQRAVDQTEKAKRAQRWADHARVSRDLDHGLLVSIGDLHLATSTGCSCLAKNCQTLRLLDDGWVRD